MSLLARSFLVAASVLMGCSEDSSPSGTTPVDSAVSEAATDDTGGGETAPEPALDTSKFCSATLKTEQTGMETSGAGGWVADGSTAPKLPAGTVFMLGRQAPDFGGANAYTGYLFLSGKPIKINSDFLKGLTRDTDFTSACPFTVRITVVLLKRSTFYANKELTGEACVLEAGTEFSTDPDNFGGPVADISTPEIKALCGFDEGFSPDIVYGVLLK